MHPIRPRTVRISGAFLVYRTAARIAPDTVSRSEPGWSDGRFHRAITPSTPRYDAAFSENTVVIPDVAMRNHHRVFAECSIISWRARGDCTVEATVRPAGLAARDRVGCDPRSGSIYEKRACDSDRSRTNR